MIIIRLWIFFENKICRRTHSLLFWFSLLALHSSSVNLSSMETQERGLLLQGTTEQQRLVSQWRVYSSVREVDNWGGGEEWRAGGFNGDIRKPQVTQLGHRRATSSTRSLAGSDYFTGTRLQTRLLVCVSSFLEHLSTDCQVLGGFHSTSVDVCNLDSPLLPRNPLNSPR